MQITAVRFYGYGLSKLVLATLFIFFAVVMLAPSVYAHDRPDNFATLAEKLSPSVVNISTTTIVDTGEQSLPDFAPNSPFDRFLDEFGDQNRRRQAQALGSGFIIDASGIVVTNNHVIEKADQIRVILQNDKAFVATLLGRDPKTDVAVLKIDPEGENLIPVAFGDSDTVKVGNWVLAIGNPFGLGGTVTAGIVSARGRNIGSGPYDDYIQTDASINRGNSGGPLFNLDGEVIGINTAIFSQTGGSVGIGFAISSNLAFNVVEQLRDFGRTRRGWLGVFIQELTPEIAESLGLDSARGALVSSVHEEGPAAAGGVLAGDVILRFDHKDIIDTRSLPRIVAETAIGKAVEVLVMRSGSTRTLTITLGELEQAEEAGLFDTQRSIGSTSYSFDDLGFTVAPLTDEAKAEYDIPSAVTGVVVTEVVSGSSAAVRGIAVGDVIRRVGQQQVGSISDLVEGVRLERNQGRASLLLLIRSGSQERFVALPIEK